MAALPEEIPGEPLKLGFLIVDGVALNAHGTSPDDLKSVVGHNLERIEFNISFITDGSLHVGIHLPGAVLQAVEHVLQLGCAEGCRRLVTYLPPFLSV